MTDLPSKDEDFVETPTPEEKLIHDFRKNNPLKCVDALEIITDASGNECSYKCKYHTFFPPKDKGYNPFTSYCHLFEKLVNDSTYRKYTSNRRVAKCVEKFGEGPFLIKRKRKKRK